MVMLKDSFWDLEGNEIDNVIKSHQNYVFGSDFDTLYV